VPKSYEKIPNVIIRPYIQKFLNKTEMGLQINPSASSDVTKSFGWKYSKLDFLAAQSGVSTRRIYDILNLDNNCLIDTADKLFCGMDKPYLWFSEPELRRYYYPEQIAA
jgi:hypothetical protein